VASRPRPHQRQYQAKFKELSRKRYRPVDVSGYEVDGTGRYAGIFVRERGAPAFVSHHGMTSAEYQQYQYQYDSDGYRLPSGRREGAVDTSLYGVSQATSASS